MPLPSNNRPLTRVRNLLRRPFADQWLVWQVFILMGAIRLTINCITFTRLEKLMGGRHHETVSTISMEQQQQARKIYWAINVVSPLTPWTSNCLPQAITAKLLLRRRGIASTLYLGAAFKTGDSALQAHAWLRCGHLYVTGGNGKNQFGAIVSFGE